MKHFLKSSAALLALSVGLLLPNTVYAIEPTVDGESESSAVRLAEGVVIRLDEQGISQRFPGRSQEGEMRTHEINFAGGENETVVVYWDSNAGSLTYDSSVFLFDSAGQEVAQSAYYADGINFDEMTGRHRTFRLPSTGRYRLVLETNVYELNGDLAALEPEEYLLNLRVASYFERLMLHVGDLFDEEQYEAALLVLEQAIAHNPDHPLAYFARVYVMGQLALDNQPEEFLTEAEENVFPSMYTLFQSLSSEEQQMVIDDLRRAGAGYAAVVERGETTVEMIGFDPVLFGAAADFVQTGTPADVLRDFVENEL